MKKLSTFVFTLVMSAFVIKAQSLSWDPDLVTTNPQGGAGIWDMNTTANWWNGSTNVVWPNTGTNNDAVFGGTAGTVTLSSVTANDLTFSTTGYTLSSSTLTLNGTTPTITVGSGLSATINSALAGSTGLKLEGGGTLSLGGVGVFTAGNFEIGTGSADNTLTVTGGGKLTSSSTGTSLLVGSSTFGGNSLTISTAGTSGAPSVRAQSLTLGGSSSNNTLTVSNGAYMSVLGGNSTWNIGTSAGANGNSLLITGTGSTVDRGNANGSALNVGLAGDNNFVKVDAGGKLAPKRMIIGQGGDNNYVLITGTGSSYDGQSYSQTIFQIGSFAGAVGNSFRVENGATGTVGTTANQASRPFSIGGAADGTNNNYVRVTGSGSVLTLINTNPVAIGGQITGGNSTPTIADSITSGNTATGNHLDVFSGGSLNIGGATSVTSLYVMGVDSAFNLGDGTGISTATVGTSGGVFSAGVFLKNADSRLNFNGGRLTAGATGALVSGLGQVQLNGAAFFSTTFSGSTLSTVVAGTGTLTKEGTGTLDLSAANTYLGVTTVSAGTLRLSNQLALQSSVLDTSGAGVISLSSVTTPTFGGLTGSTNLASVITTGYGGVTSLTLNSGLDSSADYSGVIANGAGAMTLTKTGAGTQILSGANTYTGATAVSAGTLLVNGSLAGTAVTIASGATLGGSGILNGLASFASGSHLAPGNSPGTLTFAAGLTLTAGSTLDFQLGSTSDRIAVTGGLLTGPTGTGGLTLNLSDAGGFAPGTYTLFTFLENGTSDFSIDDFALGALPVGTTADNFSFNLTATSLNLSYSTSAVPEPSTYAALAGLAALGLAMRCRRRIRA